jgi:hypothetical protein
MMVRNILEVQQPKTTADVTHSDPNRGLHATLWILWTAAVVATALFNWYSDVAAGQPVNMLGLVIYAGLTGSIGLVIMTLLEMWLDPQRFID